MFTRYRRESFTTEGPLTQATMMLPADPDHPISANSDGDDIVMSSDQACDFETPTIDPEWLATRGPSRVEAL